MRPTSSQHPNGQDPALELAALRERCARLEQDLARERDQFVQVLSSSPTPIVVSVNRRLVFANQGWCRLHGVASLDDVPGQDPYAFVAPESHALLRSNLRGPMGALRNETIFLEFLGLRRDGSRIPLAAFFTRVGWKGDPDGIMGFVMDMTQQKRIEARYRAIFDSAGAGIALLDADGRYVEINQYYADLFGCDHDAMCRTNPLETIHPSWLGRTEQEMDSLARGETSHYEHEKLYLRPDGSTFWARSYVTAIRNAEGELENTVCVLVEITQRKRMEEELSQVNQELEQRIADKTRDLSEKATALERALKDLQEVDRRRSAFFSAVSHELRTPLTSIMGFATLIKRETAGLLGSKPLREVDLGESRRLQRLQRNCEIIEREAQRLGRLVNDSLELTRMEEGASAWLDILVEPAELARQAAQTMESLFAANPDVDLRLNLTPDLPHLRVDPDRITQVLVNLLANACRFTRAGHVLLRVFARPATQSVCFEVADTGAGILESDLPHIFEKFYQGAAGEPLSGFPGGTGLGLAISRNIVRHYGGAIEVESNHGEGSRFTVCLPAAEPPAPAETALS